ncbi:DUF6351 family protein [Rhizocola hellebori]|uniref:DUF6351 family protein n=1 Tax=Rhizocola hellebori TaxID=1392758 RepID=UPI0019458ED2|nr:DUF6351 family protein [Rhizocola hellebori]
MKLPAIATALLLVVVSAAPATASPGNHRLDIDVLSSRADQVTGGDALIRVSMGAHTKMDKVKLTSNGVDVTASLTADPAARTLTGVVGGLREGWNILIAFGPSAFPAVKFVRDHGAGPIFSGPRQYPFLCRTESADLGQPVVDNQEGQGYRVLDATGAVTGWSRDCAAAAPVNDRLYRASNGQFKAMPADGTRPADMTTTTTLDGRTLDYVIKRERGVNNRFIYSIAMLDDETAWNKRVIYRFDGGVAIGRDQGRLPGGALYHEGLSLGYAILYSTGNRTNTHYNLTLGGETALMLKERFIEEHGVPMYTVGVGGSGGGLQQYVYGQNYGARIIDAAIPQYSYSDMVTQGIHVADCELLEYYMDVTDRANPKWQNWDNRTALIGMNGSATVPNPYLGNRPGSDECVRGWRGLTPLTLNPLWTQLDPLWARMDPPGVAATVHWTHAEDLKTIYGVGPDGYARNSWDNVGVQYGLKSLTSGLLTPAEFLDLNEKVGTWKPASQMVQEGCPFTPAACADPAQFDPWSARNMQPGRTTGDRIAIKGAYESGHVFTGKIDIPIIDWRHYLEDQLDMHNSHQSFASRQRMLNYDGNASNQVIWFTDARPAVAFDQTPQALTVIDEWMRTGTKPAAAVDKCFTTTGAEIASGPNVWDGILNDRPAGTCTSTFPIYGTSRMVAGGPIEGSIYACHLQSVSSAIAKGLYGSWTPTAEQQLKLEQIFPTGVCDYTKGDAGKPGAR